ncbi:hypothetical protein PAXRUDRAFT_261672 [Paxillus rubicundulus Ve08.2h10]|uniref:Uncharacterized protein n=1 Tax=Paxillus rubicundulus Ve08.2h10 TaxID=930991 RepID=A0A0D0EB04_9AGAM|nr:hypothetical protein PAXRUDRAFT_261672 [Paxillus rubicundulus Ve08.2h10]
MKTDHPSSFFSKFERLVMESEADRPHAWNLRGCSDSLMLTLYQRWVIAGEKTGTSNLSLARTEE